MKILANLLKTHFLSQLVFFAFFSEESENIEIFKLVEEPMLQIYEGVSVTIFAYGASSSGKTFTMQGIFIWKKMQRVTKSILMQVNHQFTVVSIHSVVFHDSFNLDFFCKAEMELVGWQSAVSLRENYSVTFFC